MQELCIAVFRKSQVRFMRAKKINNLQAAAIDAGARIELAAVGSCDSEHCEEPAAEDLRVEVFSGPAARTILHDSLKLGNVGLG